MSVGCAQRRRMSRLCCFLPCALTFVLLLSCATLSPKGWRPRNVRTGCAPPTYHFVTFCLLCCHPRQRSMRLMLAV